VPLRYSLGTDVARAHVSRRLLDSRWSDRDIRAMFMPAARLFDAHICPMQTPAVVPIPHVGGPIAGPCVPTVLVEGMPAAVVGDQCICAGPPDVIVLGSLTVLIAGKFAARVGDPTAHGGMISAGASTVFIGDAGGGVGSAQAATMSEARTQGAAFTKMSCDAEGVKAQLAAARGVATPDPALMPPGDRPVAGSEKKTWIEIELVDEAGVPVPRERYRVTAPGGERREGFLNEQGFAREDGLDPGTCTISFPDLDRALWGGH